MGRAPAENGETHQEGGAAVLRRVWQHGTHVPGAREGMVAQDTLGRTSFLARANWLSPV